MTVNNMPLPKNYNYQDNIDPNAVQSEASNPEQSVWVAASAGSGKTKVLTERILRLLLPDNKNLNACPPHKILALTYTKAGASEMSLRIQARLSEWATIALDGEKGLLENLSALLGYNPYEFQIEAARKLFALVVDTPGGLKIMTIHSFCQSVLGRFPLEAGISPSFKPLEEDQAVVLLKQAHDIIFNNASNDKTSPLSSAIRNIVLSQNEDQFSQLIRNIISERRQFKTILKENFGIDGLYNALCNKLNVPAGLSVEDLIYHCCDNNNFDEQEIWNACKALSSGSKTDGERGKALQHWLEKDQKQRAEHFDDYLSIFITNENTIRKTLATAAVKKNNPDIINVLETEASRIFETKQTIEAIKIAEQTRDLFIIGEQILATYQRLKKDMGGMDFDDLIIATLDLLKGNTPKLENLENIPSWVRYKLDQGIDHLLVDEAQDTNPEQWEIIQCLTDDFFSDQTNDSPTRTLFVVGDQKQSIFRFQRAAPEKFVEMRKWFAEKIKNENKKFEQIPFITSFRSGKAVLELVDSIFSTPEMRYGLDDKEIIHHSFRNRQKSLVELWPVFKNSEKIDIDPWEPPINIIDSSTGASKMANFIGQKIASWVDKENLESHGRKIKAGDILILVKSRSAFINQLVRVLKSLDIPINGVDRMILNQQLIVEDLTAAAKFALLPEDDLNLACLLKSPFIGWDEQQIFDVCYDRKNKNLWDIIKEESDDAVVTWLENLITTGNKLLPYDFFTEILNARCPAHKTSSLCAIQARLGEDSIDPLNEFMNNVLDFEMNNIPSLQGFIQKQSNQNIEIKRQLESHGNAVRIMTVHGAKGLESPIVILPDTIHSSSGMKSDRILWPNKSDEKLPFLLTDKSNLPNAPQTALQNIQKRDEEEYKRLLYVALTRAEDKLYIGGYMGSKTSSKDCWYDFIEQGFEKLDHSEIIIENDLEILRYKTEGIDKPDKIKEPTKNNKNENIKMPEWLFKNIKIKETAPRVINPSRVIANDSIALSPLKADENDRFKRGNITHKLLQILPDLPKEQWEKAAIRYVERPSHNITQNIANDIVKETMKILNDVKFANIFGENSIPEVPVTGIVDGEPISGQIDRLLVTDKEVLIVDYKTNRPPPLHEKDVPPIYKNQMRHYANIMREIYPGRQIRAALIWTDGARLMELTDI